MTGRQKNERRFCPLTGRECLHQECQMWVRLLKHCDDPLRVKTYQGCGLVATVPWKLEKRPPAKGEMETEPQ